MATIEKIAVMQAYVDGKRIEVSLKRNDNWRDWVTDEEPSWNWGVYEYRIKPEPKEPTYRPYKDFAEFRNEWEKHGGWAKSRKTADLYYMSFFDPIRTPDNLFKDWVWADDSTPCGFKEE